MTYEKTFDRYLEKAEEGVFAYLPKTDEAYSLICDAMLYSIRSGGKRIRPVLSLAFCELCGGDIDNALPFAAAIEYIHTYSLIHDDLPCMDNDDMRRGQPASHIKFGEANALLTGDALLTHAFSALSQAENTGVSSSQIVKAVRAVSMRAGVLGMIGGQFLDLAAEEKQLNEEEVKKVYMLKTCELIKLSCELGCIAAKADEFTTKAALKFAEALGMAFQIRDDILDATSTAKDLGKPIGSDAENKKSTYYSILGLEKAKERAASYTREALEALDSFEGDTEFLKELTHRLLNRKT